MLDFFSCITDFLQRLQKTIASVSMMEGKIKNIEFRITLLKLCGTFPYQGNFPEGPCRWNWGLAIWSFLCLGILKTLTVVQEVLYHVFSELQTTMAVPLMLDILFFTYGLPTAVVVVEAYLFFRSHKLIMIVSRLGDLQCCCGSRKLGHHRNILCGLYMFTTFAIFIQQIVESLME